MQNRKASIAPSFPDWFASTASGLHETTRIDSHARDESPCRQWTARDNFKTLASRPLHSSDQPSLHPLQLLSFSATVVTTRLASFTFQNIHCDTFFPQSTEHQTRLLLIPPTCAAPSSSSLLALSPPPTMPATSTATLSLWPTLHQLVSLVKLVMVRTHSRLSCLIRMLTFPQDKSRRQPAHTPHRHTPPLQLRRRQ